MTALRVALERVLEDPATAKARAEAGRAHFERAYALPANTERLAGLLQAAVRR